MRGWGLRMVAATMLVGAAFQFYLGNYLTAFLGLGACALAVFAMRLRWKKESWEERFVAEAAGAEPRRLSLIRHGPASEVGEQPGRAGWRLLVVDPAQPEAAATYDRWEPTFADILPHTALFAEAPLVWRRATTGEVIDLSDPPEGWG